MNWTTKTCRRLIVKCITYDNNVILRSEGVFDNMTVQTLERKRKGFSGTLLYYFNAVDCYILTI